MNRPLLVKEDRYISDVCECTPLVYEGRLLLMECQRPASGGRREDHHLTIRDVASGEELARFAEGYSLACALVHEDAFYVYASRLENGGWKDVTLFRSADLKRWDSRRVIAQQPGEQLFNTSVCPAEDGFVMAIETNDLRYVPFSIRFARSRDLVNWKEIPGVVFAPDRYAACPCLRYVNGYYYMLYLEHKTPDWRFETYLTCSPDLREWEPSPQSPVLAPGPGEDINASDPDVVEFNGNVYLYYSIGDQRTYMKLKRAVFDGTLAEFFAGHYLQ